MTTPRATKGRIVFMANCVYGNHVAGGDIHFFHMAEAAMEAGYEVHFFGGQALKGHLKQRGIAAGQTCTDHKTIPALKMETFSGQLRLLWNYWGRFCRTLFKLSEIRDDDIVYAVTDYWFDVWPVILCKARSKMMIWHMQAPSFSQIICRSRADVESTRMASFYYWLSQNLSLAWFRFCRNKQVLFVHPTMQEQLLERGYEDEELCFVSFGLDVEKPVPSPKQDKIYDAIWLGRVHRQKGIEDLLATLSYLARRIENFRAILVGNLEADLSSQLEQHELLECVEFAGFVSDEEKFRLFQASRVFLMTSRFEGSPRVVAEALTCTVPVVAYEVETYRVIFGDFLCYVTCFDLPAFQRAAEAQIRQARVGKNYLRAMNLEEFNRVNSWQTTGGKFCTAVSKLQGTGKTA